MEAAAAKGLRAVRHDLLNEKDAGTIYVAGNPKAKHQIIFIPGFPCDQTSFFGLAAEFVKNSDDVFVGCTCLPEFDRVGPNGLEPLKPEGYNWKEQLTCFHQAIKKVKEICNEAKDTKLVLVCHDWGTASAFAFSSEIGCDKLVCFDVIPSSMTHGLYNYVVHTLYQKQLALSFGLSRYVSSFVGQIFFVATAAINFGLLGRWLRPTGPLDYIPGKGSGLKPTAIKPFHMYPYWHYIFDYESFSNIISLNRCLKKSPILYLYGAQKNTMFHSPQHLVDIENAGNGSKVVRVEEASHWLYKQQPEICYNEMKNFIFNEFPVAKSNL